MEQNSKYADLIMSELQYEPDMAPDFREIYRRFAERVLWIDGNLVPGAFQMNPGAFDGCPIISEQDRMCVCTRYANTRSAIQQIKTHEYQ